MKELHANESGRLSSFHGFSLRSHEKLKGTNDFDMNFLVGNDLGNAVYCQWLRHTLSEEQWNRMFDHSQSVNEERAGDAVEVCLATLYFTTLFPFEFRFWGDPSRTMPVCLEHSIRSFAVSAGCLPATGSQRVPPSTLLSPEVVEMGKRFAAALGNPAVTITLEEYYLVRKKMKDGPVDLEKTVKEEPDDDNVTDVSAEPGVADAALYDGEEESRDDDVATSTHEDAGPDIQDDVEAPATPISTKKRRIGTSLEELMTQADDLKVCVVCWMHHSDFKCPRSTESEALYTALSHLLGGGAVLRENLPAEPAPATTSTPANEPGNKDVEMDTQGENVNDAQDQSADAEKQDATDIEIDETEVMEVDNEPPTIMLEAKPRAKARPTKKMATNKISSDESDGTKSVRFLDLEEDVSPLGKSRGVGIDERCKCATTQESSSSVPGIRIAETLPLRSFRQLGDSEGEVDWTRGKPPLKGRVRSLKILEMMVSIFQRGTKIVREMISTLEEQASTSIGRMHKTWWRR